MCNSNTAKAGRILTGIISVMLLVIVLFSAFYISAEAEHDCTGEDCQVCAVIQQSENTLRGFADGMVLQLSAVVPVLFIILAAALFVTAFPQETLISRKVRLNN